MRASLLLISLFGWSTALQINYSAKENPGDSDVHQKHVALARSKMSFDCTVDRVDTETQTIHLKSDIGNFMVKNGKVHDEEGKPVGDMASKVLVCTGNADAPSDGPAFFWVTSGAKYLYKDSGQGAPIDFLMNKHCWAKKHNVQYYLWIGEADPSFMKEKAPDAVKCKDAHPGNHYFVVAGMHLLLKEKPNSWIISMDISDTFFTKSQWDHNLLGDYLDENFDFIGGATTSGVGRFINGAIVAGKGFSKSPWATNFYSEWFKNRCGGMNQLAMWSSLFKIWENEDNADGAFHVKWKKFEKYGGPTGPDHGYARQASGALLKGEEQKHAFKQWTKTGKLDQALQYPHVLVHGNTGSASPNGIAFRADRDRSKESFMCHNTADRSKMHPDWSCNTANMPTQC